jgi:glycosyltransferase involved in cell wall biosynthesis
VDSKIICSTIIPTIGRPTLTRAVYSVLNQEFDRERHEIIVVNDSGQALKQQDWMRSERVQMIHTNRRNRSVARNSGAAVARGKYFHFLDDDDWILPGAFLRFHEKESNCEAGWIYGGFRLVDHDGEQLAEVIPSDEGNCFIQMLASEWLPLQASWILAEGFWGVGGFASLEALGGGFEDIDISRLIARNYEFAGVGGPVAVIRFGDVNSTTNYNDFVKQNRFSRERTLDLQGAYLRLRDSAGSKPYWVGRIAYYYLASFRWNVRNRRLFPAISRMLYFLFSILSSGFHLIHRSFWRGALRPHLNLVRTSLGDEWGRVYQQTTWKN